MTSVSGIHTASFTPLQRLKANRAIASGVVEFQDSAPEGQWPGIAYSGHIIPVGTLGSLVKGFRGRRVSPLVAASGVGQPLISKIENGGGCQLDTADKLYRGLGGRMLGLGFRHTDEESRAGDTLLVAGPGDEYPVAVGRYFWEERASLNLTIDDVAERAGRPQARKTVHDIENGEHATMPATLERYFATLGIQVVYFGVAGPAGEQA